MKDPVKEIKKEKSRILNKNPFNSQGILEKSCENPIRQQGISR